MYDRRAGSASIAIIAAIARAEEYGFRRNLYNVHGIHPFLT